MRRLFAGVALFVVCAIPFVAHTAIVIIASAGGASEGGGEPPAAASSSCEGEAGPVYVRDGGTGDGSAWDNALDVLPATLSRDAVYYVADGSYAAYTFNDATDGTKVIEVCKATVADHGTDTGWLDTYGDGAAAFASVSFTTSHWDFDGATGGGPGSWTSGFGFTFSNAAGSAIEFISVSGSAANVTIRHVSCAQVGDTEATDQQADCLYIPDAAGSVSDITFEYAYIDNISGLPFFLREGDGLIIQYVYTGNICGMSVNDPNDHCEALVEHGYNDVHFRWNYIAESPSSGGYVKNDVEASDDVRIYGNVFSDGFAINCNTGTCDGWRVFNNTFHHMGAGPVGGDGTETNVLFYNNIMVHFDEMGFMWDTHDYNWFSNDAGLRCDMNAGANENIVNSGGCDTVTETSNPFVDVNGSDPEDWVLTSALAGQSGTNVCTLTGECAGEIRYDEDMFGNTRGEDGTWDRGAMEFDAS